jgi:hypothetical protein
MLSSHYPDIPRLSGRLSVIVRRSEVRRNKIRCRILIPAPLTLMRAAAYLTYNPDTRLITSEIPLPPRSTTAPATWIIPSPIAVDA